MLLGLSVPDDAVMHVGIDAYLAHLTAIEILTVLVAQRRRRAGGAAAAAARARRFAAPRHRRAARIRCRAGTAAASNRWHHDASALCSKPAWSSTAPAARRWPGDVLLVGDRIAAHRRRPARAPARGHRARRRARSSTAAARPSRPGFIDAHTHDDAIVLRDPAYLPKLSQGITTVVTGNCGISLAPYRTPQAQPPLTLLGADSFRYADDGRVPRRGRGGAAGAQRRRAGRPHDAALRHHGRR